MEIPDEFLEKVANYLSFRPYREVAGLLAELNKIVTEFRSRVGVAKELEDEHAAHDAGGLPEGEK